MTLPFHSAQPVLTRLLQMSEQGGDAYACISARREHAARSVQVDQPQLAIVLRGNKRVRQGASTLDFAPGDALLIRRRCAFDVVHTLDPHSGVYLTAAIPLCAQVLEAARVLWDEPVVQDGEDVAHVAVVSVSTELAHWCDAMQLGRYIEARVALTAVVIALCRLGHAAILSPPPPSVAAQVRTTVHAQPGRDWQSRDFEQALGLSGATLRRRLAAERTSLREVIADARLACAINLLYTTRWPVKTVAAKVGYSSAASFVRRFTERYGMDPAQIGNA